jgi:hypothetical protein
MTKENSFLVSGFQLPVRYQPLRSLSEVM